jgi:hypothetical protein
MLDVIFLNGIFSVAINPSTLSAVIQIVVILSVSAPFRIASVFTKMKALRLYFVTALAMVPQHLA